MLPPAPPDGIPSTVGPPLPEGGPVISLAAYRQGAIDPNNFVCPITGELWLNSVCAGSSTKLHDSCVGCPAAKLRCLVRAIGMEIQG
ncbi:hypothetical protein J0895_20980 [Phormidium pseudopriestleyi FRX01]|uniref:Uncharacterized protein n=1 Tax=Phormidium pseudopriestleyi FRX01 TaxID=1759528 RepID=A0ABS3FWQ6_9CYAN|nr:hypothetical protein [Phormidium pseudopriestleyi]MBO0351508.1 hypothetical protein [Phormidium pseudopriestleyi FRX01]